MKKYIIAGLSVLFTLGSVHAAVVGIDLSANANTGPTAHMLPGVVGKISDVVWNRVSNKNLYSNLKDEDGTATGADFQITGGTLAFSSTTSVPGNNFLKPVLI